MGCDIHLFLEHRTDPDSQWQAHGKWGTLGEAESAERLEYFSSNRARWEQWHTEGRAEHPDLVAAAMAPDAPDLVSAPIDYRGRNYSLFSALAGVRNSVGIIPIVEPRGMPADPTTEVFAHWARWGPDAHSASHLTLTEVTLWEGWRQTFDTDVWVSKGPHPHRRLDDDTFARLERVANDFGELPHLSPDAWNLATCSWSSNPDPWRVLHYTARLDLAVGAAGLADEFTTEVALQVLHLFAGAWPTLGRHPDEPRRPAQRLRAHPRLPRPRPGPVRGPQPGPPQQPGRPNRRDRRQAMKGGDRTWVV